MNTDRKIESLNKQGAFFESLAADKERGYLRNIVPLLRERMEYVLASYKNAENMTRVAELRGQEELLSALLGSIEGAAEYKALLDKELGRLVKRDQLREESSALRGETLVPTIKE